MEKKEKVLGLIGEEYEMVMGREKRKNYGSFYTPDFIIDYIIKNATVDLDVLENPFVKIIDPACGVGYFLIKAYDNLMNKFLEKIDSIRERYKEEEYIINISGEVKKVKGKEYWIKENLHYHILKNCIYGADIDSEAVRFTKINLISKGKYKFVLEPNIICCNSLIKWEQDYNCYKAKKVNSTTFLYRYNDIDGIEKEKKVKKSELDTLIYICKFWSEKYDYVIGNPPWVSLNRRHKRDIDDALMDYYINRYNGNKYLPNLYEYFIRRSLDIIKDKGKIGFVVPDRFAKNLQYKDLRKALLENYNVLNLAFDVDFPNINTDTMVFIIEKNYRKDNKINLKIYNQRDYSILQKEYLKNQNYEFLYENSSDYNHIKKKVEDGSKPLGDISTTFTGFIGDNKKITRKRVNSSQVKILKGESISRFGVVNKFYYEFIPENIKGGTKNIKKLACPLKVIVRKTGKKIIAALDTEGYIVEQSLYGVINLSYDFSYKYVLGILNSKLIEWYYLNFLITNINSTPQIKKYSLNKIPIKFCTRNMQNKIETLVDKIMFEVKNLKNISNEQGNIVDIKGNEKIYNLQSELDEEIFKIYGLNHNDVIKIL